MSDSSNSLNVQTKWLTIRCHNKGAEDTEDSLHHDYGCGMDLNVYLGVSMILLNREVSVKRNKSILEATARN